MSTSCGTCVHWHQPRDDFATAVHYAPDETHRWEAVEERQEREDVLFGDCRGVPAGFDMDMSDPTPLAVVVDGSHYRATLFTRAEFGCRLWSDKEDVDGPCVCGHSHARGSACGCGCPMWMESAEDAVSGGDQP